MHVHTHAHPKVRSPWKQSVLAFSSPLVPTWLMLGRPCFFLEVVSRPQREENLLLRLLVDLDMAWVRRRTPVSPVRAATWGQQGGTSARQMCQDHTPGRQGLHQVSPFKNCSSTCRPTPKHLILDSYTLELWGPFLDSKCKWKLDKHNHCLKLSVKIHKLVIEYICYVSKNYIPF